MRVVLLGNADNVHVQRWVDALAARDLDLTLVTQHKPVGWTSPDRVRMRVLPFRGPIGYFANAPRLKRILRDVRPELLNVHFASGYGTMSALVGFPRTVLSVWGSDVFDFPYRSWVAGRLIRRNLRRAQRIASTSHVMAAQVRRLVPEVAAVDITPFGVDSDAFHPQAGSRAAGECTIGTVKTLADKYGVDVLIRAFSRLATDPDILGSGIRLRLVVVGDGPKRESLEELTGQLELDAQTQFVGKVAHRDVPAWLNRMDIFVAASRLDSESFGVAVIEASSCALPVVVSDAGGLPEVVQQGETGLIVPREDVAALHAAMKRLVLDADLRQTMGSAGREFVRREYEWDSCVDRMLSCYEAVIGTR